MGVAAEPPLEMHSCLPLPFSFLPFFFSSCAHRIPVRDPCFILGYVQRHNKQRNNKHAPQAVQEVKDVCLPKIKAVAYWLFTAVI